MITHIVFLKLKDRSKESIKKAKDAIEGMRGKVPVLRHLEVGVDVMHTDRSYDMALVAKFDSLEDLDVYMKHPGHVKVSDYLTKIRESVFVVDYESQA